MLHLLEEGINPFYDLQFHFAHQIISRSSLSIADELIENIETLFKPWRHVGLFNYLWQRITRTIKSILRTPPTNKFIKMMKFEYRDAREMDFLRTCLKKHLNSTETRADG